MNKLKKIMFYFCSFYYSNKKEDIININYYQNSLDDKIYNLSENEIKILKMFFNNIIEKINLLGKNNYIQKTKKINKLKKNIKINENKNKILELNNENMKINEDIIIKYCWQLNNATNNENICFKYTLNKVNKINVEIKTMNNNNFYKINNILEILNEHYFKVKCLMGDLNPRSNHERVMS